MGKIKSNILSLFGQSARSIFSLSLIIKSWAYHSR
ncbi:hypothetical protein NEOC65_002154 [Neochlamydia sp. AcF65]|nr:hypothetical protein [Neochlamydia sp. AcF65]MBS4170734.1 hypothetical protein [Neochlamydia sp. AcF95]